MSNIPMSADTPLLEGQALSYRIGNVDIIRSINVRIGRGELVGLIGPNGAGKSTLLRITCGIEQPTTGAVLLDNQPLARCSTEQRARRIGYLAQGAKAYWPLTVQRVVALGRLPHLGFLNRSTPADQAAIEHAMALAEVIAYRNRLATTLSGGEQTLVMLARIFATCPDLIFADEPVAALDPYHQLHVMELLRAHADAQRACVVVLHDLGLAARFCDRLYLFRHGEVFAEGEPRTVLTQENLQAVYGIESKIECTNEGVSITPLRRISHQHP